MIQKHKNEVTVFVAFSFQPVTPFAVIGVEPSHPGFSLIDEPHLILFVDGFLGTGLGVGDCQCIPPIAGQRERISK